MHGRTGPRAGSYCQAGPAEERHPVVRRQRVAVGVATGRVAPQVEVGVRPLARLPAGLEPGVLVARVVHHEVEDHPEAPRVRLADQPVEVVLRPEQRIDRRVVADVVADIAARARVDRRQPDGVDAQPVGPEVIEMLDDPAAGRRCRCRRCRRSCADRPGRRSPRATTPSRGGRGTTRARVMSDIPASLREGAADGQEGADGHVRRHRVRVRILGPMAQSPSLRVARRPLRVGVAGLGAVAQAVHLPLLARLPGTFEIAAICDLSSALTRSVGERYRVPAQHRYRRCRDDARQRGARRPDRADLRFARRRGAGGARARASGAFARSHWPRRAPRPIAWRPSRGRITTANG